jgi:subtilisin family serine protease
MCEKRVQVGVFDHEGRYLENALVRLEPEEAGRKAVHLQWERSSGCYVEGGVAPGRYRLVAQARWHDPSERPVQVEASGLRAIMLLGPAGLPFLYRGHVKTPFQPQPDLCAIALDDNAPDDADIEAIARDEGLDSEFVQNGQPPRHARVFRFPAGTPPAARAAIVQRLVGLAGVHRLGPLVHFDRSESFSCLTDELVIRFRPEASDAQIRKLTEPCGLTRLRTLTAAENLFVFRMAGPVSYEMLALANDVAASDLVHYAEPNLVSIGIHDAVAAGAIGPEDFLFPMQWHLPLIRCRDAWQLIGDRVSPDRAMGSSDITIAVVDWGIDVDNPEFAGSLSNGQAKVSTVFDFHNMVANNNARSHGHGTCCAGVATALANNGGVCGAAGNCRLMAIRRPEGIMAKETAYSDMYLWIAGFDPKSPTTGFPQPIRRGADVITNSFGYAAGLPISGLMQDTFDLLTEHGRDGRGVLLFFSTGNNDPPVDFTLLRPWAAHPRTLAVAASTLASGGMAETRAKQSNFGGAAVLDFCAPSATALGAEDQPPNSYAVVTAGDRTANDPDRNLCPNAPSECKIRSATTEEAAPPTKVLRIVSGAGFGKDAFVLIGMPGTWTAEFHQIAGAPEAASLELRAPIKNRHPAGTVICTGPAYSVHRFSGTSCATAIAAGVGALLLSARPELGWREVRELLRTTAVKIDAANANASGIWRDVNGVLFGNGAYRGPHYSRGYGFGRIDALAAVEAALVRRGC